MTKSIVSFLTFALLVLVIFFGSSLFRLSEKSPETSLFNIATSTQKVATSSLAGSTIKNGSSNPAVSSSGIKMSDVQKHNNQAGCWTVVNGGVYDLTSFVSAHPGGSRAILSLCGIDGTSAFLDQHGNQKRPNNELAGLKIGDLAK